MRRLFYALAILAIALGIASPYVWRWYWYHTAKLAMSRTDERVMVRGKCYTR